MDSENNTKAGLDATLGTRKIEAIDRKVGDVIRLRLYESGAIGSEVLIGNDIFRPGQKVIDVQIVAIKQAQVTTEFV